MKVDFAMVAEILATIRQDVPLESGEANFFDLGFDSLDVSALFLELERRTGLTLTDDDMTAMTSADAVVARLSALAAS
jgi:acyl carrier protein